LAQAGVELPKPKEPKVADAEGIERMDSTEKPALLCGACICRTVCLKWPLARGFRVLRCHVVPAFLIFSNRLRICSIALFSGLTISAAVLFALLRAGALHSGGAVGKDVNVVGSA
jgi:hypothetical protein